MSERPERGARVLFVLGRAAPREEALRAAVALSARLSAELEALFVEDEELLRAASLPIGSHVLWGSAQAEPFEVLSVLRDWRALAERARQVIEHEARSLQVPLAFRVLRGAAASELSRAFEAGQLVMFASARAPTPSAPSTHLEPRRSGVPVRVLVDASPAAERALEIALALANATHPLEVWVTASDGEGPRLREKVRARVGAAVPMRDQPLAPITRTELLRTLNAAAGGILVLPETTPLARAIAASARDLAFPCWIVITS